MEKLISEMLGFFLVALLMILLFIFGALYYHVQQYNQFKNQCIEVVQRTGEMEPDASGNPKTGVQGYLNTLAKRYYAGYGGTAHPDFTVEPVYKVKNGKKEISSVSKPQIYGHKVQFYIIPNVSITQNQLKGSIFGFQTGQHIYARKLVRVTSQVRRNSQANDETKINS